MKARDPKAEYFANPTRATSEAYVKDLLAAYELGELSRVGLMAAFAAVFLHAARWYNHERFK